MLFCSVVFFFIYAEEDGQMQCFGNEDHQNIKEDAEVEVICDLEVNELHPPPVDQI